MDVTTGRKSQLVTEGAKDREKRGVEIQSEMQDVQVCEKRR
jgi:hypothetical protein